MEGERGERARENRDWKGTGGGGGKGGMRKFLECGKWERKAKRYLSSFINALKYIKKQEHK